MSGKKRGSGKRKPQRKGLSGNPQRRDEQLQQMLYGDTSWMYREPADAPRKKPRPFPWWPESHARVLASARADAWPTRLIDVETRAGQVAGDEFYERIRAEEKGLDLAYWLAELAARTGEELRTAIENGDPVRERLWALLRGLALIAPRSSPFPETDDNRIARLRFPLDDDPFEVTQAETARAAAALANRGLTDEAGTAANPAGPAGEPVVARDAYGSRVLLAAPFGYRDAETDHWYAWDIDMCGTDVVVGAGVFDSAEESLEEWRGAVGASASGAALAACPEPLIPVLLDSCLRAGPNADFVDGYEPRELVRELYRMRQRARALAWRMGFAAGDVYDYTPDYHAFQGWYGGRHDDVPSDFGDIVATIISNWGPLEHPDAGSFYACSPHRIEVTAILLRDQYAPELANETLAVLPEWVEWCLSRGSLDDAFAALSRAAVRAEAAALVSDDASRAEPGDEGPFRRQE